MIDYTERSCDFISVGKPKEAFDAEKRGLAPVHAGARYHYRYGGTYYSDV